MCLTLCVLVFSVAEMHRTQTQYDNAFIFKVFIFQFVNFYSSPFYVAFFKGRWDMSQSQRSHRQSCNEKYKVTKYLTYFSMWIGLWVTLPTMGPCLGWEMKMWVSSFTVLLIYNFTINVIGKKYYRSKHGSKMWLCFSACLYIAVWSWRLSHWTGWTTLHHHGGKATHQQHSGVHYPVCFLSIHFNLIYYFTENIMLYAFT